MEEEPKEEEATRQKEFLERVVVSQKSQLRQLEKLQKLNCVKMMRDNKVLVRHYSALFHVSLQMLLKEIETLKKEMVEIKRFKVKLPAIKSEERKLS
jgi:hypothetical protein